MSWNVEVGDRARRDYLALPADVRERIEQAIDDLRENPRPPGVKRLVGKHGYRIRKGDCRVLYAIDDAKRIVRVYAVGHRRDVYRSLR